MDRSPLLITVQEHQAGAGLMLLSPDVAAALSVEGRMSYQLRFGSCQLPVRVEMMAELPDRTVRLGADLFRTLSLPAPLSLLIWLQADLQLALGPLIGLLIARAKLRAVLEGDRDTVYCRYARYAREIGAVLLFFTADGLDLRSDKMDGYVHVADSPDGCEWQPVCTPIPTVVYDRCFGRAGREEAAWVRKAGAGEFGGRTRFTVVNHLPKITKLQAFGALGGYRALRPYLPYTAPLNSRTLRRALRDFNDLYLKPDALYKGKGVFRLSRDGEGWRLRWREEEGNREESLPDEAAVREALTRLLPADQPYLLQEGLDLATYLGNRFDFRSLVQRNGAGHWMVTGLVARIAADGAVITSPRSGGQVAPAAQALQHAFPDRWTVVLAELERVSLELARHVNDELGPCVELGLDVGVLRDGMVKLIEVNGKPLRVSLERLNDPLVGERINRWPIHYAAFLDTMWERQSCRELPANEAEPSTSPRPLMGLLLDSEGMTNLAGGRTDRYRQMVREAAEADMDLLFFTHDGIDAAAGRVRGMTYQENQWAERTLPVPAVIYNRSVHSRLEVRQAVLAKLHALSHLHGMMMLNSVNATGKLDVYEALAFFRETAAMAPETVSFCDLSCLEEMLGRYDCIFLKSDYGSHGSDVLRIRKSAAGWEVRGRFGGRAIQETFRYEELVRFLLLLGQAKECVLQQGISLPEADGRLLDIRAIAQKDGEGVWQVPAVLVRVAQAGNVATNMALGGEGLLPESFLERYGGQFPALHSLREDASQTAVLAATAMESRFGRLGEVGLDLAVEPDGRYWVLEVNTKPMHPKLGNLNAELIRYPFQYGAHLINQMKDGRQSGFPLARR